MNAFTAHWFDGVSSRMHAVTVSRVGADVQLSGDGVERCEAHAALRITPRLAATPRTIHFPCGGRVLVADHVMLDAWFPSEDRLQRLVARLEHHALAVVASIAICISASVSTFVWGVPWLADRIAEQIPPSIETRLGDSVLGQLDNLFGLQPSELDEARRTELTTRFRKLADPMPNGSAYRIEFRHAPEIGANALALPGGIVVVTDELTYLFDDDREFDAVVAHEIGHQQERHALRQTLRSSFVAIVAAFFAGDVSAASTVVIGVPTFLLQSHYSRG
ncbi:MAG: M48 family metallopeptidase, partial [Dokdonella sp.]